MGSKAASRFGRTRCGGNLPLLERLSVDFCDSSKIASLSSARPRTAGCAVPRRLGSRRTARCLDDRLVARPLTLAGMMTVRNARHARIRRVQRRLVTVGLDTPVRRLSGTSSCARPERFERVHMRIDPRHKRHIGEGSTYAYASTTGRRRTARSTGSPVTGSAKTIESRQSTHRRITLDAHRRAVASPAAVLFVEERILIRHLAGLPALRTYSFHSSNNVTDGRAAHGAHARNPVQPTRVGLGRLGQQQVADLERLEVRTCRNPPQPCSPRRTPPLPCSANSQRVGDAALGHTSARSRRICL